MSDALARALRWGKEQFSLDTPKQDLMSPETAGDMALGLIPGVGQAMAVRDMARGVKAEDPTQVALAAAGLIPFGKLGGALKNQIIAGRSARHAPVDELAAGEGMLRAGQNPRDVWKDTGTFQGTENHMPMKWEISDKAARLNKDSPGWVGGRRGNEDTWGYEGPLKDLLHHPELFKNYPELGDYNVLLARGPNERIGGGFTKADKSIDVTGNRSNDVLSTLLHEIQHGVQGLEGFDSGASYTATKKALVKRLGKDLPARDIDDMAHKVYERNMGETEARAVEKRIKMSDFEREFTPPIDSYDRAVKTLLREDQMPYYATALRRNPSD